MGSLQAKSCIAYHKTQIEIACGFNQAGHKPGLTDVECKWPDFNAMALLQLFRQRIQLFATARADKQVQAFGSELPRKRFADTGGRAGNQCPGAVSICEITLHG